MNATQVIAAIFLVGVLVWGVSQPGPDYEALEQSRAEAREGLELLIDRRAQEDNERRQAYVDAHRDLSPYIRDRILEGSIVLTMTREQVVASWGEPDDVNRSVGSWGSTEQWVYRRGNGKSQYIYFENGHVSSFQG